MVNYVERVFLFNIGSQTRFDDAGLVVVMTKISRSMLLVGLTLAGIGAGFGAGFGFAGSVALAQETKTLGKGKIVVRLCPATCVAVNGHGLKPGGKVTVFETKSNWVRVSDFLNRSQLVKSFGNSITRKPALWVAASQLVGSTTEKKQETPAQQQAAPATKPAVSKPTRIALPTFRPGTQFSQTSQPAQTETESATEDQEVAETKPVENTAEPKTEVVESVAAPEPDPTDGVRRQLTWEELQQRLAKQAQEHRRQSQLSEAEKAAIAKRQAEQAAKEAEEQRHASSVRRWNHGEWWR